MSEETLIRVEAVSKKFCRHLKRSLWYGIMDLSREFRGRPRSTVLRKEEFWAVDDVSLTVRRGEIMGLIGPNGSGKTTMLRLINGLIMPDKGRIAMRGQVGALIQLGAGFSPVLSGYENILINAAVLGIPNREVSKILDDIIDFADIGEFISAPVRSYSSGMRARLGFSVAIHMKPDILLVDEVLAVGDLVFRNKALEKMLALAYSGVAVVFVSHNLSHVDRICHKAVYLNRGRFVATGPTAEVISNYVIDNLPGESSMVHHPGTEHSFVVHSAKVIGADGREKKTLICGEAMTVRLTFEAKRFLESPLFTYMVEPTGRQMIAAYMNQERDLEKRPSFAPGLHTIEAHLSHFPLLPGGYQLRLSVVGVNDIELLGKVSNLLSVRVDPRPGQLQVTNEAGFVELPSQWNTV